MQPRDFLADDFAQPEAIDYLAEAPKESFGKSLAMAIPRVGEDVYRAGYNAYKNIPRYAQAAKTEVPAFLKLINATGGLMSPEVANNDHAAKQALAGFAEAGHGAFNLPHDIVNYLSSGRLNLLPEGLNKIVQQGRMPSDTQGMINEALGTPNQPGEALLRGATRNVLNVPAAGKALSPINPMRLTNKSIANEIINTAEKNKNMYSTKYNKLFENANKQGFEDALYNVDVDFNKLKRYTPAKKIEGVREFLNNPSTQSAHTAKSDLGKIKRKLEEKTSLTKGERNHLNVVNNAIGSLEGNMFKNAKGELNKNMLNEYKALQKGYARDVVPYQNKSIAKYRRNKLSAGNLVKSLANGEFGVERGAHHPLLMNRNKVRSALLGIGGIAGGLSGLDYLKNALSEKE